MLNTFKDFMLDTSAWDMYVTGSAGTGKTTALKEVVEFCHENNISYVVCAYTHKACRVLATKLPENAKIATLHSYLKKVPRINTDAEHRDNIQTNVKIKESERVSVILIDEFSMVGERDLMDIRYLQDSDYDGEPSTKVVYIGDLNQLPPVKDQMAIVPTGDYVVKLTKIHRQASGNPLLEPLAALVSYIEGMADPAPLLANSHFIRSLSTNELVRRFIMDKESKVFLTYTNEKVQLLNQLVKGYNEPKSGDEIFCAQNRETYTYIDTIPADHIRYIELFNGETLALNSKYRTLEFLKSESLCEFYNVETDDDSVFIAATFGTHNYKRQLDVLGQEAVKMNNQIKAECKTVDPAEWCRKNPTHKLARARALAWRRYLSYKDCVWCLDFPFAMTIHKSQGSTFDNVYLDAENLAICKATDFMLYLKLFYVAISRAANKVYTN
jgi:ATP-dependent exoDNAse (exonuclease V) alpha subunit